MDQRIGKRGMATLERASWIKFPEPKLYLLQICKVLSQSTMLSTQYHQHSFFHSSFIILRQKVLNILKNFNLSTNQFKTVLETAKTTSVNSSIQTQRKIKSQNFPPYISHTNLKDLHECLEMIIFLWTANTHNFQSMQKRQIEFLENTANNLKNFS